MHQATPLDAPAFSLEKRAAMKQLARQYWQVLRAAARVLILFWRRRLAIRGSGGATTVPTPRKPSATPPGPASGTPAGFVQGYVPLGDGGYAQKVEMFRRILSKPLHARSELDVKLVADFLVNSKFVAGLPSPSVDELARCVRFCTVHDGEVLFRQGDAIIDTSARYMVVRGSLMVFCNAQYAKEASEGEDFEQWFKRVCLATGSPSAVTIRYGDCINTCGAGDTCGDDAFKGPIFRTTTVISQAATVVAYVTQADYNRVARFRVDENATIAGKVLDEFYPGGKSTFTYTTSPKRIGRQSLSDPAIARLWMRFLSSYECFRGFSGRYQLELASKLECCVLQSNQAKGPITLGPDIALRIVLRGQLCVHKTETTEEMMLRKVHSDEHCHGLQAVDQKPGRVAAPRGSVLHAVNGVQACGSCDHVCLLSSGSCFGETAILFESANPMAGVELFVPPSPIHSPSDDVVVLLLSHEALASVRAQYLDSLDFAPHTVHAILFRIHPRDRTGEQLTFIMEYLRNVSPARVFFQQLSVRVLYEMCLHSSLETFDMSNGREMACIQKEGCVVDRLRVILNGYVAVFKNCRTMSETEASEESGSSILLETTRELLKREQSRLIRGANSEQNNNAKSGMGSGLSSASPRQSQHVDKIGMAGPVGILPFGASFGQLQLFTGSKSPYSYAAYSSGHASTSLLHMLTIPDRVARLCLPSMDDILVYNPIRLLRRVIKAAKAMADRDQEQVEQHTYGLNFERLLLNQAALAGLPRCRVVASVPTIRILDVPAKHFIYETGESTRGVLYVLLSGTARLFRYSGRQASSPQSGDNRRSPPKFSAKVSALMRLKGPSVVEGVSADFEFPANEGEAPIDEMPYIFDRRADDSFFSQAYTSSRELAVGDGFGCCGDMDAKMTAPAPQVTHGAMPRMASKRATYGLPTAVSSIYQDTAVAMTDCKIGVLFSGPPSAKSISRLSTLDKIQLQSWSGHHDDRSASHDGKNAALPKSVLTLGLRALEQAELTGKLSSSQRFELVKKMEYCTVQSGEKVFQAGEEGRAVYLIVSGQIRIYSGVDDQRSAVRGQEPSTSAGAWTMLLGEGDTFGEEAFINSAGGCTRAVTAVVEGNQPSNVSGAELFYLTRDAFDEVTKLQGVSIVWAPSDPSRGISSDPLFGFYKITPLERWKRAVHHIIRQRTMRSQWYSVLYQARQRRAELVWNLVRDFEGWKDMRPDKALQLCAYATLNVFGLGAAVYSRDEEALENVYVVVSGAVAIQQPTISTSAGQPFLISSGPNASELATTRVVVRVLKRESCFGEFELLANSAKRVASAIVSTTEARVLSIAKCAFLQLWPHRPQMETKLQLLQRVLLPILPLDDAQLCSLYYAVGERTFQREQVVSSVAVPASTLFQIIASGMCVVHDSVSLQLRKKSQAQRACRSQRRQDTLSLDTRLATLGPGAILFARGMDNDPSSLTESRRVSTKETLSVNERSDADDEQPHSPTEYVVADSPLVTTLMLELPPTKRFLADVMLGRHGLDIVRSAVVAHQRWRGTTSAEVSLRLAVASVSKSSTLVLSPVRTGLASTRFPSGAAQQLVFPSLSPAKPRMDLVQFLQGRELPNGLNSSSPCACGSASGANRALTAIGSPRVVSFPSLQPSWSPSCLPSGSFALNASDLRTEGGDTTRCSDPVRLQDSMLTQDNRAFESRAETTSRREHEQLRKEQITVALLSRHSYHWDRHKQAGADRDKRHRHGRPPSKQVSTRAHFVDVFTASPPRAGLENDHERKKSALVRRLQHVNPVSTTTK